MKEKGSYLFLVLSVLLTLSWTRAIILLLHKTQAINPLHHNKGTTSLLRLVVVNNIINHSHNPKHSMSNNNHNKIEVLEKDFAWDVSLHVVYVVR
ncbi:hypothetical protein K492DRAFT_211530 [Lichtheimia hyalospora FSU 10163]|nr:hypothetical protein K492DRAFT_211530 [Lichtheimia hyalospora FSU 10163]